MLGRQGVWEDWREDNRQFLNAVFWIMGMGAPWRDLPPDYGNWSNTHRRFISWCNKDIREKLLEVLIDDPDYEWPMIDASHYKVHPHAAGVRGKSGHEPHKKGLNTKIHLTVDARMVCLRVFITQSTIADCTQADRLIEV
ncbi:IS5 family transposase [Nitrosomonas ureae]|uniref:IS5 family transposase n=1 Tax=Nitrosomonas ureae TaxID=44577 RepID=UPI003B02D2DB